tara:strand:- start:405 stop:1019 length:615 start_codon:yes stop_codon:yes gene_type:complete
MTSKLIVNSVRHTGASADGITMAADGSVTFPGNATCSGTATGFGSPGITEIDSWYLTSSASGTTDPVQNNLSRCGNSNDAFNKLGTGMTVSSGIWTFPSTGFWLVQAHTTIVLTSGRASRDNVLSIESTENNSTYFRTAPTSVWFDNYGQDRLGGCSAQAMIDCTDTSNVKIKFKFVPDDSQAYLLGASDDYWTRFNFIRLADT